MQVLLHMTYNPVFLGLYVMYSVLLLLILII